MLPSTIEISGARVRVNPSADHVSNKLSKKKQHNELPLRRRSYRRRGKKSIKPRSAGTHKLFSRQNQY
jgi:hypothetical protein